MRFLADMGVSRRVVDSLRGQGHEVTHLRDQGLQRLPNGEIFAKAVAEERVVITFVDFGEIIAASHGKLASVVLFLSALGIDPRRELTSSARRPLNLSEGTPIATLLGA